MMNIISRLIRKTIIKAFNLHEIQRDVERALSVSEKKYRHLFENNPQPMWIYELETLAFLEVNNAAIHHYGYSRSEFLNMTIKDIRPDEDVSVLLRDIANTKNQYNVAGEWRHKKKNGEIIYVEIISHTVDYDSKKARLVLANDISKRKHAEQKLKTLSLAVEQNPASILITDKNGNIEYVNSQFTQITGYTLEEVVGKNPSILKSGVTTKEEYKQLWDSITSGKEWEGYFQNRKKNGEIFFESVVILPILDEKDQITHYLAIKEDVTTRVQTVRQIKTLSKAIEQSPVSIIITGADGKIEFVNYKFTSFMQYSLNEVRGRNPRIFNPGHTSAENFHAMWESLKAKNSWQGEFLNRKKDGTFFWENVLISPLIDERGDVSNFILIMEDISEKKKMIQELVDAKNKAQESDRLKTAFLQNMSHEIRTPMNAIIGFSNLLPDVFDSKEKLMNYTNIIKERSSYLLEIINDLLDIARIESGQLSINLEECHIENIFKELDSFFEEFRERINKTNVRFTLTANSQIKPFKADKIKLKQVLINLISNAFKFTPSGHVEVKCDLLDNNLIFSVSDTGIGIPENMQAEIFERFKQAHSDKSHFYGGTGLGLSIVKGILQLLGGKIWVESEVGMGSTFYFSLEYIPS